MIKVLDNPLSNDNRKYDYDGMNFYERKEFPIICDWIKENAKVIDLGCGNGSLMKYILERKKVAIEGLDTSSSGVNFCLANGLNAKLSAIDQEDAYRAYSDGQFDFAVCNVTLQMVLYPDILLREIKRISKFFIISFPNFAYLSNRLDLMFCGRMPRKMLHGYTWYNTGHIHQLSLGDFKAYCKANGIKVMKEKHLGCLKFLANKILPNLFSKEGVFLCSKQ